MDCNVTLLTRGCLVIASLLDVVPGMVHFLAPDGGAGSIAGVVLEWENATSIEVGNQKWDASSYHKQSMLVMFSALGITQIKFGVMMMLMALLLPQGNGSEGTVLCRLTWALMAFQMLIIIVGVAGYRHIHSIASTAPGGYKSYLMAVCYVIATISQIIWYHNQKEYAHEGSTSIKQKRQKESELSKVTQGRRSF